MIEFELVKKMNKQPGSKLGLVMRTMIGSGESLSVLTAGMKNSDLKQFVKQYNLSCGKEISCKGKGTSTELASDDIKALFDCIRQAGCSGEDDLDIIELFSEFPEQIRALDVNLDANTLNIKCSSVSDDESDIDEFLSPFMPLFEKCGIGILKNRSSESGGEPAGDGETLIK